MQIIYLFCTFFHLTLIYKITLMRRPTITPSGRNSTKPRVSLSMSNTSIRREIRNVRDKDHLYTCTSTLENFLIKHDYPFTPKTLTNPSAKDVASLFKLIFSMYDSSWEYSLRFEEDVILILKGLKYPYMCEINRSQFIAITPHSWPVILSMLAWLVELVSIEVSIDNQSFISLFNKHLISGYSGCMQGIDSFDEEGFEIDVKTQYKDVFSDINKKLEVYQEIEDKTEKIRMEMKSGSIKAKKESLVKRRDEIKSDLENLKMRSKQLAEKKKKYENITNELIKQNESLEKENNLYVLEIEKLKKLVDEQQIKPEDIDDMTKDKNEMYSEMERLRPVKEQTIRELSENEKIQNDTMDMLEKMLFDLKNISDGVSLYKTYKERNDYKIEFIGDKNEKEIDELSFNLRNAIDNLTEKVLHLESRKTENEETKKSIFDELKQIESIVLAKGKFYIEKKAMCGVEHKKMSGELGILENEILKMNMESQHAVLIAEKKYQKKQIEYDRYRNTKQMESEMLAEAVEKLRNVLINVHASLEMSYKEF